MSPAQKKRRAPAIDRLETLEDRVLLAATLYVDNTPANGGTDFTSTGGTQPALVAGLVPGTTIFTTIAAAYAAAAPGDTINISDGTYTEGNVIAKAGLIIQGNQFGVDAKSGRVGLSETIINNATGSFAVSASNVTIDGLVMQDTSLNGFASQFAIALGTAQSGVVLKNNIFQNNTAALSLANTGGSQARIERNLFRTNNIAGPVSGTAIYTSEYNGGGTVSNVLIDSNRFSGNSNRAILSDSGTTASPFTNVIISGNDFDGNGASIYATNFTNSSIINNTFQNSTDSLRADLRMDDGVSGLAITGNVFRNGAGRVLQTNDDGLPAPAATTITFGGNSISGYTGPTDSISVSAASYTGIFNASNNWWGTNGASAVAAKFTGSVDFTPWLNLGTDTNVAVGFQGDLSSLHVDDAGSQFGGGGRVAEAIGLLADGSLTSNSRIVQVESGTYAEAVNTTAKALTLVTGASPGQVTFSSLTLDTATANDKLDIEINGTSPGTGFDQIVVNSGVANNVALGGATLSLTIGTFTPADGAEFIIISNDLVDPVSGTFAGLPDGAIVSTNFGGSGKIARISYAGGDGNDVSVVIDQPNLVVTFPPGDGNPATSDTIRLDNVGNTLQIFVNGVLVDTQPLDGVQTITINGGTDSDTLNLDFTGGNSPIPAGGLTFNGGAGAGSDRLTLTGPAGLFADGQEVSTGAGAGTVKYTGIGLITFTGLEPVVDSVGNATFGITATGAGDVITIGPGAAGFTLVSEATPNFESVEFQNKVAVTVNGSGGNDTFILNDFDNALLLGSLTVDGGAGADAATVNNNATVPLTLNVETVNLNVSFTPAITGTATTVNVAAAASIQDGIDVTGPNATVNIAAAAHAEVVTTAGKSVTLSPGGTAVAAVTGLTSLTLDANDTYTIQATANGVSDLINSAGAVTLGGATLVPVINYAAAVGDVYTIITAGAAFGPGNTFANLPEGGIVVSGTTRLRISYAASAVTLTVVQAAVNVSLQNGTLIIDGSGVDDSIELDITGTNVVTLSGNAFTNFTGTGINGSYGVGPFVVTGDIRMNTGNGNDTVLLRGLGGAATLSSGNVQIDLGAGNDILTTTDVIPTGVPAVIVPTTGLTLTGNLSVIGDTGDDVISLGNTAATNPLDTFVAANVSIDTGVGTGIQSITLTRATVNGNASLTNGGDLLQTTSVIGDLAVGTAISGDLIINQSSATNTGGYTVNVTNYNVGIVGDEFTSRVGITNGNGTGNATVNLTSTIDRLFTDSVTVTNGNNANNDINIAGGAGFATMAGEISLTNGVGTVSNSIDIDGAVLGSNTVNNRTNVSLTNGLSNNNDINLGAGSTNIVNGQFFASNNSGGSGVAPTNDIAISQGVFARNVQLTNGLNSVAAVANTITVATLGTGVDVTGNFVASNGNTAGTNTVNIGTDAITATNGLRVAQITPANGSGSGNVNISNGTTTTLAATVSIRGADGGAALGASTNEIDGNVSIINRGSTAGGTKAITLRGLSTFGRTGVTLNNALAGNSTVTVGDALAVDPVFINGTGGLFVQDGSGTSTLNVALATIGTLGTANQAGFRYQDLSGGADTINIGNVAGGSVTVNGVTRLDTAGGNDAVVIANTAGGVAAFNDSVFIDLGAGNDSLIIGNNAASPAFGSADKFQFNGGAGVDVVNGDQSSLSSWTNANLKKKLKSKVTGFETKTVTP